MKDWNREMCVYFNLDPIFSRSFFCFEASLGHHSRAGRAGFKRCRRCEESLSKLRASELNRVRGFLETAAFTYSRLLTYLPSDHLCHRDDVDAADAQLDLGAIRNDSASFAQDPDLGLDTTPTSLNSGERWVT